MAFIENLDKLSCRIAVSIGQTATGAVKTANVILPSVSKTGYDVNTFGAICQLIEPVLQYTAWEYIAQKTYSVEES